MNEAKYIGMDVHQATISVAVRDSRGQHLVLEAILRTKAEIILQFIRGLGGSAHVTFEEGTWAAWLHDLLKLHVTKVMVCDLPKKPLLRVGNHNDREDARKLSELLNLNKIHPVCEVTMTKETATFQGPQHGRWQDTFHGATMPDNIFHLQSCFGGVHHEISTFS